jgi:hypothetical protein
VRNRKYCIGFAPLERWVLIGGELAAEGHRYRVTFSRPRARGIVNQYYDFISHPLRSLIRKFILNGIEGESAGNLNTRCRALKELGDFLVETGERDLNPETFKTYSSSLFKAKKPSGEPRLNECSIAARLNIALVLYSFGLSPRFHQWSQRDLDTMRAFYSKTLRGRFKRSALSSIDTALSADTFYDLARAVTLEFEQCKQVLRARDEGRRQSLYNTSNYSMKFLDPNPYVVFAVQAAMRFGLRATELNSLTPQDIHADPIDGNHEIYVHAPDKGDDFIPVDDLFMDAFNVCKEWDKEAREVAGSAGEGWFEDALLVYRPTSSCYGYPFVPLTTYYLNASHLKYFFKKWFDYTVNDENGNERPLLHTEGDATKPFKVDYRKLRNAFAVRFAEREKNRDVAKRVMRHKNVRTTEIFYLRQSRLDFAKKVHMALKPEAQMLVMGLKNALDAGITEDTLQRAKDKGALTPEGVCGAALEGKECEMAKDCLECPHLIVLPSRRIRFVADRDTHIKRAEEFHAGGDLRGAENALSRAKLCQAHILRIDETFNSSK